MTIEEFTAYSEKIDAAKKLVDRIKYLRGTADTFQNGRPPIDGQTSHPYGTRDGEHVSEILGQCLILGLRTKADQLEAELQALEIGIKPATIEPPPQIEDEFREPE